MPSGNPIDEEKAAADGADTAFFVLARIAGENKDRFDTEGDYFISKEEKAILAQVSRCYKNVVLVINTGGLMDLAFVEEFDNIRSILQYVQAGQEGGNAFADVVSGDVTPSGKMTDTWAKDYYDYPGAEVYSYKSGDLMKEKYEEGIFVGYRYFDTFEVPVRYSFGYGMSYTDFEIRTDDIKVSGRGMMNPKVSVTVTVTNTGDKAGKDVVEVYYNPPYTDGGIEKASKNLVAFEKTKKLEPGASQTVKIEFDDDDMASYDQKDAKAYVLEQGDYDISIQSDSHHVIDHQKVTVKDAVTYDSDSNTHNGDAVAATNEFDYAAGDVTYLSRAGHFANYAKATAAPTNFSMSDEAKAEFTNNSNYDPKKYDNDSDEMPTTGAKNGLKLYQMYGKDYDDADWDKLLDQLTFDDMDDLIANGGYGTPAVKSVGKIQLTDADGPASLNNNFTGVGSIGFPASTAFACTWNRDLAKQFGEMIGDMAHDMHVAGWYAPAMNIHRSAFSGRTFEYFSEDSLLSGAMASNEIAGAKSKGVYSFMKHFALNDQETNRTNMVCTWANEQSIRETYLKPFEMSVKEGGAQAVMSSFNYIGYTYAGASSNLLQTVLRDEWGFKGFVLTDYFGGYGYQNADQEVRAGNDSMLATTKITNHITDKSATSVKAMRQAAHNILYTAANGWQYANGEPKVATPIWKTAMYVAWGVTAVLVIGLEIVAIKRYLNRKKAVATVESAAEPVAAGPANAE